MRFDLRLICLSNLKKYEPASNNISTTGAQPSAAIVISGVSFVFCEVALILAPAASRILQTSGETQQCSGEIPLLLLTLTGTFTSSTRNLTTSTRSAETAIFNGVSPRESARLGSAPAFIRAMAASEHPFTIAL